MRNRIIRPYSLAAVSIIITMGLVSCFDDSESPTGLNEYEYDSHDIQGIAFVSISPGMFLIGDIQDAGQFGREKPIHDVSISGFEMSKYEVTQEQYESVIGSNPAMDYGVGDTYPVYNVSWYDAVRFCN